VRAVRCGGAAGGDGGAPGRPGSRGRSHDGPAGAGEGLSLGRALDFKTCCNQAVPGQVGVVHVASSCYLPLEGPKPRYTCRAGTQNSRICDLAGQGAAAGE
jgi:hypothetical protein